MTFSYIFVAYVDVPNETALVVPVPKLTAVTGLKAPPPPLL